jgi:hypothetical protein
MIKTLEALISAIILLATIVILFSPLVFSQPQIPSISYNCIRDLDNKGFLRQYAENYQLDDLKNKLKDCMPSNLDYSAKICNTPACNPDSLPNKEVYVTSYILAGDQNSENRLINLWVWFK